MERWLGAVYLTSSSFRRRRSSAAAFAKAAFNALAQAYSFLTPDLWRETKFLKPPNQEHTDFLAKMHTARKSTSSLLKPQGA